MNIYGVHETKTRLSELLGRVAAGEELIIAQAGVPVARLVPAGPMTRERPLGTERGRIAIAEVRCPLTYVAVL